MTSVRIGWALAGGQSGVFWVVWEERIDSPLPPDLSVCVLLHLLLGEMFSSIISPSSSEGSWSLQGTDSESLSEERWPALIRLIPKQDYMMDLIRPTCEVEDTVYAD